MKILKLTGLVIITMLIIISCKKSGTATNWSEELKGSVWAGEFKYTSGANTDLQPFSIVLSKDNTLNWTDIQSTRAGGIWEVNGNKITLKFLNGTFLSADLSKDKWINFNNPAINGFAIDNLSQTTFPTEAVLDNTTWTGQRNGSTSTTEDAYILFKPGKKAEVYVKNMFSYGFTYVIEGAGVRDPTYSSYFIFLNNTPTMKGYDIFGGKDSYYELKKQ